MTNENMMKRAVIAGASIALSYKKRNPLASEEDILKYIIKELREIIENID